MRRWEPNLGPVLSRLGLVRPDLDPPPAADEARLVYTVGEAPLAAPHPGSRHTAWAVETPIVVGQFSSAYLWCPDEGAWILGVTSGPESFRLFMGTEPDSIPDGGFPANTPSAFTTTKQIFRPDDREPFFLLRHDVGNNAIGPNVWADLRFENSNNWWPPTPIWWQGCRLCITTGGPLYLSGGVQAKLSFTLWLALAVTGQKRAQVGAPAT